MQKGYNVFFKNHISTILDKYPSRQLITSIHMTNNKMFPLKLKSDLKEEGAKAQLSMNSQNNERKVVAITQVDFRAKVKYGN